MKNRLTFLLLLLSITVLCPVPDADAKKRPRRKAQAAQEAENPDEVMPLFQGGDVGRFRKWIMQNLEYPPEITSPVGPERVNVSFVVECDGSVTVIGMEGGESPALKRALWQVFSKCPRWTPGMCRDPLSGVIQAVPVRFNMPVVFHMPIIRVVESPAPDSRFGRTYAP